MDVFLAILIGIGLSAAVGFRVFTPLLITGIAERASFITMSDNFAWISSTPALIAFAVAVVLEIISLYISIFDTFMKALAAPAAIIAGTILTASFIHDMNPLLTWSLAIIAGGGTATISHFTTTSIRTGGTLATAGIGNIFLSIIEGATAIIMSISAIFLPIIIILFLIVILIMFITVLVTLAKIRKRKSSKTDVLA